MDVFDGICLFYYIKSNGAMGIFFEKVFLKKLLTSREFCARIHHKEIEAHFMNSTAHRMAPRPCGKGVGAEVCTVEGACWQLG